MDIVFEKRELILVCLAFLKKRHISLFSSIKKLNGIFKKRMKKLSIKIEKFFTSLSQDPTFIELDNKFIFTESEESYNDLISYVKLRNDEFIKSLNLGKNWKKVLSMMSDDRIPMYNSSLKSNTYDNYTKGKIVFNTKDEYIYAIRSLTQRPVNVKYYPLRGLLFSQKIGQTAQQVLEEQAGGGALLGTGTLAFLFGLLVKYDPEYVSTKESIQTLVIDSPYEAEIFLDFLIFIGLILMIIGFVTLIIGIENQ
jgi:hypothetical protein